jgi:hypothetical protein
MYDPQVKHFILPILGNSPFQKHKILIFLANFLFLIYYPTGCEKHDLRNLSEKNNVKNSKPFPEMATFSHHFININNNYSDIVKPVFNDHHWGRKKWPMLAGGLWFRGHLYNKS